MTIRNSPTNEGKYAKLEDDDLEELSISKRSIAKTVQMESKRSSRSSSPERGPPNRLDTVDLE